MPTSRSQIINEALKKAEQQGFRIEGGRSNRAVVRDAEGRRLVVARAPKRDTTVNNELARMRRFGVDVPRHRQPKSPLRVQLQKARKDFLDAKGTVAQSFQESENWPASTRERFRRRYREMVAEPMREEVLHRRRPGMKDRVKEYRKGAQLYRKFAKRLRRRGPLGLMAAGAALGLEYLTGGSREDSSGGR